MSEKVTIKAERQELHLPAIALRGLVVFPNNVVHFEVGRAKSIAAIEAAMHANSNVFLVAQKEMEVEEPTIRICMPTASLPRSSRCCASPMIWSRCWWRARPAPAAGAGRHRRFPAGCRAPRSGARHGR